MSSRHEHAVSHMPLTGTGIAVCECGATRRVEQGKAVEDWHSCPLCVANAAGDPPPLIGDARWRRRLCDAESGRVTQ